MSVAAMSRLIPGGYTELVKRSTNHGKKTNQTLKKITYE